MFESHHPDINVNKPFGDSEGLFNFRAQVKMVLTTILLIKANIKLNLHKKDSIVLKKLDIIQF